MGHGCAILRPAEMARRVGCLAVLLVSLMMRRGVVVARRKGRDRFGRVYSAGADVAVSHSCGPIAAGHP